MLNDLACVTNGNAETSIRIELISYRYEYRPVHMTAGQSFEEWNLVFLDPTIT
nr:hypothetical protein [Paraburkholderia sp. MMS20-SJTN17]